MHGQEFNNEQVADMFNMALPETEQQISHLHMHLNPASELLATQEDSKPELSELFTEVIPVIGRVPILFYVPECTPSCARIRRMIEQHGGLIIYIPECCCYQIYPECPDTQSDKCLEDYGKGLVFSSEWLVESIASQRLLACAPYLKHTITQTYKQVNFSRTKFSIREIIKIFEVVQKNPSRRTKNPTYWGFVISRGIFPGRSVHSINAQWQRFSLYDNKEEAVR